MAVFSYWMKSLAALSFLATASTAAGQTNHTFAGTQPVMSPATPLQASASPTAAAPGQFARPSFTATTVRPLPPTKPFQMTPDRPTISPYLQLHREDFEETLPNYFAFVRPQIQQQELIHQQQLELERIQQRLQRTGMQPSMSGPSAGAIGGQPQTFHARFLNTGHYFSGVPMPQQQVGADQ